MEKVLITGTSGYLGAAMFEAFKQIASTNSLNCRLEEIERGSLDYDLVIHCAGALRHRHSEHHLANVEGTKKLLEGLATKTKIVYISSKSIYGTKTDGTVSELINPLPDESYGISKFRGELEIRRSKHNYLILRASTLFGLGHRRLGPAYPDIALEKLLGGENISLFIPDVEQEYLYVQDLVNITQKLIQNEQNWNQIFNVAGEKRSLHELMYLIQKIASENKKETGQLIEVKANSQKNYFLDKEKILARIKGFQFTSYEEIIKEMIRFLNV